MTMQIDITGDGLIRLQGCESHGAYEPNDDDLAILIDLDIFAGLSVEHFKILRKWASTKGRQMWMKRAAEVMERERAYDRLVQSTRYATKQKIAQSFRMAVFERDGFKCRICGSQKKLTVDHIIPESKGGEATMENCQTLCRSCNSRKGAR